MIRDFDAAVKRYDRDPACGCLLEVPLEAALDTLGALGYAARHA